MSVFGRGVSPVRWLRRRCMQAGDGRQGVVAEPPAGEVRGAGVGRCVWLNGSCFVRDGGGCGGARRGPAALESVLGGRCARAAVLALWFVKCPTGIFGFYVAFVVTRARWQCVASVMIFLSTTCSICP
ncbi:hypothetical protein OH76DRAFT_1049764 [Lentinus brumalis]|uniref:Uncharacterized protein n=1 Tax=Lentinus brumalis TaxID=2498619 RepID=A0A371CWI9_9APHY|nr:hypothetical protein OH76DRAFT_1049764 [Polyporus brumalis]